MRTLLLFILAFCSLDGRAAQLQLYYGNGNNDGAGDTPRVFAGKVQTNFTELYSFTTILSNALTGANSNLSTVSNNLTTVSNAVNTVAANLTTVSNGLTTVSNADLVKVRFVSNIAALQALDASAVAQPVFVRGYYSDNDGGGGLFVPNASDSSTTNGGTIVASAGSGRWNRANVGSVINVLWFGARPNTNTDQTTYFHAARDAAYGGYVYAPGATSTNYYYVNFSGNGTAGLMGDGVHNTILKPYATNSPCVLVNSTTSDGHEWWTVKDFTIDCENRGVTGLELGNSSGSNGASRIRVINVLAKSAAGASGVAVSVQDATNVELNNVSGESSAYGIRMTPSRSVTNFRMIGCSFRLNTRGASLEAGDEMTIQNGVFESNGMGLVLRTQAGQGPKKFLMENGHFEGNAYGDTSSLAASEITDLLLDMVSTIGQTNACNYIFRAVTFGSTATNCYNISADRCQGALLDMCSFAHTNDGGFGSTKLRFATSPGAVYITIRQPMMERSSAGVAGSFAWPGLFGSWPALDTTGGTSTTGQQGYVYEYRYQGRLFTNRKPIGNAGSPLGSITPAFIGEELTDTVSGILYKAKGLTSSDWVALEPVTPVQSMSIPSGLHFDGSTGTILYTPTIGQTDGTNAFSLYVSAATPTNQTSGAANRVGWIGRSRSTAGINGDAGDHSIHLESGNLIFRMTGSSGVRVSTVSNFVSSYGGKVTDVIAIRNGPNLTWNINGFPVTGTESVESGTMADFSQSVPVSCTNVLVGARTSTEVASGTFYRAALFNRALSAFDCETVVQRGNSYGDQTGSQTTINSGTFTLKKRYRITAHTGTNDFTAVGAANNNVGTEFTATGTGTGILSASNTVVEIGAIFFHRYDYWGGTTVYDLLANGLNGTMVGGISESFPRKMDAAFITSGTLSSSRMPAFSGAINSSAGSTVTTLSTNQSQQKVWVFAGNTNLGVFQSVAFWSSGGLQTTNTGGTNIDIAITAGGVSDGDKGDITVSGSGSTFTIDASTITSAKIVDGTIATGDMADDAITNPKLANMAQGTLKGRAAGAGTGDPSDVSTLPWTLTIPEGGTGGTTAIGALDSLVTAEATVASAATTDLGAVTSQIVQITGTTTITNFGTAAAGIKRVGRFAGALTLTHNASSLNLPGGANITTAANDRFWAISQGSGNWFVYLYLQANGSITPAGNIVPVTSATYTLGTSSKTWDALYMGSGSAVIFGGDAYLQRKTTAALTIGDNSGNSGTLSSMGAWHFARTVTASTYTTTRHDYVILCDCTSNAITITLLAPSSASDGANSAKASYIIEKIDSSGNAVTVNVSGGSNINGSSSFTLSSQYAGKAVQSNGTQYYIIGTF